MSQNPPVPTALAANAGRKPPTYLTYPLDELVRDDPCYRFRVCTRVTLDNTVNLMFDKGNVDANLDYGAMLPIFQLMTKRIETQALMGYFSANCLSEPQDVKYADHKGTYRAIFRQPEPLREDQIAQIKQFFVALAPYLHFEQGGMPDQTTDGTCGMTNRAIQDSANAFGVRCCGAGSVIRISGY